MEKLTTQAQVRAAFWQEHDGRVVCRYGPRGGRRTHNQQPIDTRMAFFDYVDRLARDGTISEDLAARVTL